MTLSNISDDFRENIIKLGKLPPEEQMVIFTLIDKLSKGHTPGKEERHE